jgi:tetratricopeptide (TPR) repeat protein
MNRIAKIIIPITAGLIFISSCNDNNTDSPYKEILANQPFTSLTDSIKTAPKNDELYFRRAVLLNQNNFPEPALADFRKAWSIKKEEKYALGISTLLLESKPESALLFLREALGEIPNSMLLQLSLARAYDSKNKTDEALAICDQMLQQNPQQVDVLKLKADLLDKKGNTKETINTLETAYAITPYDAELVYMLALKLAETKNNRVLTLCDSLIRADSIGHHAEPYYYKGIYYSNINDKAKALSFFDQAVKRDINFMEGYIEKGAVLYEMKKYPEALNVFNLALNISPEYPDSYYWIAKCQQATGKNDEAKLNYQRAYSLDNTNTAAKDSADKLK